MTDSKRHSSPETPVSGRRDEPNAAGHASTDIVHETGALHRLLVEHVQDYAIFALDPTGVILSWNAGAQRLKGYDAHEIIGKHFSIFYPEERIAQRFPEYELETASRVGRFEDEGWRLRKDGSRFWANVIITALRDDDGRLLGFGKVTRDLTERRAAEERAIEDARRLAASDAARRAAEQRELEVRDLASQLREQAVELEERTAEAEEARRRADEANRVKGQFLAAMSHELRTPLNAIGGYAELLAMELSGPVTEQQREQLARIRRSQQHLLGIINDILNFSRIEAGQLTYDLAPVALHDVVTLVVQMLAPQATAKHLQLIDEGCPPDLAAWADRAKVEQIVLNLVSNAIKFTGAPGEIGVSCHDRGDGSVGLVVRDTGVGIPGDKLEAIFEPFVQVGRTLTTGSEGAGLGLAISRDLARGMGGTITVRSTPGEGSAFTLVLPRVRARSEPSRSR